MLNGFFEQRKKLLLSNSSYIKYLFLYTLFLSILGSFTAFLTQYLIDKVVPSGDSKFLLIFLIFYVCYESINISISYLSRRYQVSLEKYIDFQYISKYVSTLLSAHLTYLDKYNKGALVQRVYDAQNIKKYFLTIHVDVSVKLVTALVLSAIIAYMSLYAAIILGIGLSVLVYLSIKSIPIVARFEKQRFSIKSDFLDVADDIVLGRETIRANNYKSRLYSIFSKKMTKLLNKEAEVSFLLQRIKTTILIIQIVTSLIIRGVVVFSIINFNSYSLGEMLTIVAFSELTLQTTLQFMMLFMELKRDAVTLNRYNEFVDNVDITDSTTIEINRSEKTAFKEVTSIQFCGLNLGVNGETICEIKDKLFYSNRIYKIVGPNGSGKSTLCKTMIDLYSPQKGSINFFSNNKKINECQKSFCCAAYFPNDVLFNGSIRENITLGKAIDDSVLIELLEKTRLWRRINFLESSIDTTISDKINPFSEGQRQVILFLRVYLSNKPILIFDEVFRGLDKEISLIVGQLIYSIENAIIFYTAHDFDITGPKCKIMPIQDEA